MASMLRLCRSAVSGVGTGAVRGMASVPGVGGMRIFRSRGMPAMHRMRILPGSAAMVLVRIGILIASDVMRMRLRSGERSLIRGGRSCRRLRGRRRRMGGVVVHRMVRMPVRHRNGVPGMCGMFVALCLHFLVTGVLRSRLHVGRGTVLRVVPGMGIGGSGWRRGVAGVHSVLPRLRSDGMARVRGMILRGRHTAGGQGEGEQGRSQRLHASILTSRIIPASMWYSRWQWKAQRPSASARTR
ncbi:hypothetical protein [Stenotrophomonas sp. Marseille-Q4652]|uniref:hypothetical protein n=1 Tax=Stenotrophomonas sp. Marseille-Q4652 TaxID=2866595 RepID=UPI001CE47667|nr:hypothetical protein [Stenotrophomonas sp. Marseille-Q4652]